MSETILIKTNENGLLDRSSKIVVLFSFSAIFAFMHIDVVR